jgi:hypothetical protein
VYIWVPRAIATESKKNVDGGTMVMSAEARACKVGNAFGPFMIVLASNVTLAPSENSTPAVPFPGPPFSRLDKSVAGLGQVLHVISNCLALPLASASKKVSPRKGLTAAVPLIIPNTSVLHNNCLRPAAPFLLFPKNISIVSYEVN